MFGTNAMPKTVNTYANGLTSIMETGYKKKKDHRQGLFAFENNAQELVSRDVEMGTTEGFRLWEDGQSAPTTNISEGYEYKYYQYRFGEKAAIGYMTERFQRADAKVTARHARGIAKDAYLLEQKMAFSLLNYGDSSTNTFMSGLLGSSQSALLPDGKKFFSIAHACSPSNSTTWSNSLADNAAVGIDSLEAMLQNLANQLDDRGEELDFGYNGYIWVVPMAKHSEAVKVLKSMNLPGTGDNDTNPYKDAWYGRPIKLVTLPPNFLTSTTAHFLLDADSATDTDVAPMKIKVNLPFTADSYTDDDTEAVYVRGKFIEAVGVASPRGIVYSEGSGSGAKAD
jgi:hypothetical protein